MSVSWNFINKRIGGAILGLLLLMHCGTAYCDDELKIVTWVAGQMGVQPSGYSYPVIKMVDKASLDRQFSSGNEHSMARWIADHGQANAEALMRTYLEAVVGLFDPKTRVIYVGTFLSPCRQKAILAHEAAHYLQYMTRGPIPDEGMASEMILMEREMEACAIERIFEERFCDDTEIALYTGPSLVNEVLYIP